MSSTSTLEKSGLRVTSRLRLFAIGIFKSPPRLTFCEVESSFKSLETIPLT